jgi:Xaa-Pro aminopeptidase
MQEKKIKTRIEKLRIWMQQHGMQAYIIPSADPHKSEYLAEHWMGREWISGFTGSAGTVIVTLNHVGLWTDSRYYLQAESELNGSGIALHRMVTQGAEEYLNWLSEELMKGDRIGVDASIWSVQEVRQLERVCSSNGLTLILDKEPFENIWEDRPGRPMNAIFELDNVYSGESRADRLDRMRLGIAHRGADAMLVTALDDVAWLLNLRGRDVSCNPVFVAYAIIDTHDVRLFVDPGKIDETLKKKLDDDGVKLVPYELIFDYLDQVHPDITILIDPNKTSQRLYESVGTGKILLSDSPIMLDKTRKNEIEQDHLRQVMVKDGVALLKAFRWLEDSINTNEVSEADFADKIASFRSQQEGYFGESFQAIVGYESNGAIVHYRPEHGHSAIIKPGGMLLVDSGGQYLDGTTDITRTIHLGEPTADQKRHFTLVLKGHIALAKAVFPAGTRGIQLDVFARQYLWNEALDYGHGTGHGVGFFMNVHEPPQGFVSNLGERGITVHEPGMYTSNEPGFYIPGQYGIRIENLVLCQEYRQSDFGRFLCFETVTLFPIEANLIDKSMLSESEISWLNTYHRHVYDKISPHLDEAERQWLEMKCGVL